MPFDPIGNQPQPGGDGPRSRARSRGRQKDSVCDVRPLKTAEVRSATRRVQSLRAPRWSLYCTRIKCWRGRVEIHRLHRDPSLCAPFERGRRVDQLDRRPRWNVGMGRDGHVDRRRNGDWADALRPHRQSAAARR